MTGILLLCQISFQKFIFATQIKFVAYLDQKQGFQVVGVLVHVWKKKNSSLQYPQE